MQADSEACRQALVKLDSFLAFLPENKPTVEEALAVKHTMLLEVGMLLEQRGYTGVVSVGGDDGALASPPVQGEEVVEGGVPRMPSVPEQGACGCFWGQCDACWKFALLLLVVVVDKAMHVCMSHVYVPWYTHPRQTLTPPCSGVSSPGGDDSLAKVDSATAAPASLEEALGGMCGGMCGFDMYGV